MGQNPSVQLQNQIFELKFAAKQLERASKKQNALEKKEHAKLVKAMKAGNSDIARVYAGNAIRQKAQALNYLRLASRMDAVASRLQTVSDMSHISQTMAKVTGIIGVTMKNMDVEASMVNMDVFEKQCQDLDVNLAIMEGSMKISTASAEPEDQIENLMKQIADENGLEVAASMNEVVVPTRVGPGEVKLEERKDQSDEAKLAQRLRELTDNA